MRRQGLTLFEVAIALGLAAASITGVLLVFPVGIRAQQLARFQLLACAKAEEMIDAYDTAVYTNCDSDAEAPHPWDVPVGYANAAPDLESRLSNPVFGIMPLPTRVARRLDSPDDEIARLIADGGCVYYAQPMATTGLLERSLGRVTANDSQKLVFGVVGYAQSNAVALWSAKQWPYYAPFPSPPLHCLHGDPARIPASALAFRYGADAYCWEALQDPTGDTGKVFGWHEPGDGLDYGFKPYAYDATPSRERAIRYVQAALWWCARRGLPGELVDPADPTPLAAFAAAPDPAAQVQGLRWLSHAATCLTRWCASDELAVGVVVPSATLDGRPSPAVTVTEPKIRFWHDTGIALAMRFAASFPYDWRVPRPLQRAIMMDCPLLEYDLWSPPRTGTIAGSDVAAEQWRMLSASPIVGLGTSVSDPGARIPTNDPADPAYAADRAAADYPWGDPAHVTIARPFAPAERSRQLVFWAVDWQAFEDCETAPSATIDAARYNLAAPRTGWSFADRMSRPPWTDVIDFTYRNPEKNLVFTAPVADLPTGADVGALLQTNATRDQGLDPARQRVFLGLYGADRNFNHRLDRGPLPVSARLRAQAVARFAYYDRRVDNVVR